MFDKSILIVEDSEDIRAPMIRFFTRKGFQKVQGAAKAEEALAKIEKEKPDLILLDIQLEDVIDGVEILKMTKTRLSPASLIVMLSGHKDLYEQTCKELGAYDSWGKPIDPNEMLERVKKIYG